MNPGLFKQKDASVNPRISRFMVVECEGRKKSVMFVTGSWIHGILESYATENRILVSHQVRLKVLARWNPGIISLG